MNLGEKMKREDKSIIFQEEEKFLEEEKKNQGKKKGDNEFTNI